MNLRRRRLTVNEAVKLVLDPQGFFEPEYVPRDILNENKVIHLRLGAENTESVELEMGGWVITGVPDAIFDDRVVEVKVQRPLSKAEKLLQHAYYQGALYASALKLPRWETWIYVLSTEEVKKYVFEMEREWETVGQLNQLLLTILQLLEKAAGYVRPLLRFEPAEKIKLQATKEEAVEDEV